MNSPMWLWKRRSESEHSWEQQRGRSRLCWQIQWRRQPPVPAMLSQCVITAMASRAMVFGVACAVGQLTAAPRLLRSARTWESCRLSIARDEDQAQPQDLTKRRKWP